MESKNEEEREEIEDLEFETEISQSDQKNWELIFSKKENEKSVYQLSRELRKDKSQNLYYKLTSIIEDNNFLKQVLKKYPNNFSVFANLRCGLWYSPKFDDYCYFKSTDGHSGHWKFNLTRLNLNVAQSIALNGGCIIVDSTRKGKEFPDSFSRTIPIWACVLNRAVFSIRSKSNMEMKDWDCDLHFPSWVSPLEAEHVQKVAIESFVQSLLNSKANLSFLVSELKKPLRALWISPSSFLKQDWLNEGNNLQELPFLPIICVSVSKTSDGIHDSYIQGAGDDEESWAMGLTPKLFWENKDFLFGQSYIGIEERLQTILSKNEGILDTLDLTQNGIFQNENSKFIFIGETGLVIGSRSKEFNLENLKHFSLIINCSEIQVKGIPEFIQYFHIPIKEDKKDKNKLLKTLPSIFKQVEEHLGKGKILFYSMDSLSIPASLCLGVLIQYYEEKNNVITLKNRSKKLSITKEKIREFLQYIQSFSPQCRIPRVMMNDINRFFLTPTNLKPKICMVDTNKI